MNRTATALIALATVGGIAAASAAVLGVSADATAVSVEQQAAEVAGTQANLFGTSILLPENVAAFYLENGQLTSVGNTDELSDDTLATITAQLTAAPAQSVLYVDTASAKAVSEQAPSKRRRILRQPFSVEERERSARLKDSGKSRPAACPCTGRSSNSRSPDCRAVRRARTHHRLA